jgi:hypothetical protein
LGYNIPDTESVMSGSDKRKKVALSDIKPGGKYYCKMTLSTFLIVAALSQVL